MKPGTLASSICLIYVYDTKDCAAPAARRMSAPRKIIKNRFMIILKTCFNKSHERVSDIITTCGKRGWIYSAWVDEV